MQSAKQLIQRAIRENPEVSLVLEIATRARDLEARELPKEIGVSTETTATPVNSQSAV